MICYVGHKMDWIAYFTRGAFYIVYGSILTEAFWSSDGNNLTNYDDNRVI